MSSKGRIVFVGADGNVERALRKFKKKVQEDGTLLELRARESYIKPTTRRKIAAQQARSRWLKHLASQTLPTRKF